MKVGDKIFLTEMSFYCSPQYAYVGAISPSGVIALERFRAHGGKFELGWDYFYTSKQKPYKPGAKRLLPCFATFEEAIQSLRSRALSYLKGDDVIAKINAMKEEDCDPHYTTPEYKEMERLKREEQERERNVRLAEQAAKIDTMLVEQRREQVAKIASIVNYVLYMYQDIGSELREEIVERFSNLYREGLELDYKEGR